MGDDWLRGFRISKCIAGLLAVCILNVFSSAAEAGIISEKQEIAIGQSVAQQIEFRYHLLEDTGLQQRIDALGQRLAAVSDRPELTYSFKVLDVDEVNAMAVPGGFIYVNRSLIELMPSDDELAGIIGHELGHVVFRHSVSQLEKTMGMQALLLGLFGSDGLMLQMAAVEALAAGYSRDDEREADVYGYRLAVRAGYNPYGMLVGLNKLNRLHPERENDLFSDHPETQERIRRMEKLLAHDMIRPQVRLHSDGISAMIYDGKWELPPFKRAMGAQGAYDRACLTAGRLAAVAALEGYDSAKYILMRSESGVQIFYDDKLIIELTPYDAEAAGCSIDDLVNRYLDSLRSW